MWFEERKGMIRYKERYIDPLSGKKKTVSITLSDSKKKTQDLARDILKEKIKDLQAIKIVAPKDLTLEQLTDKYYEYQKKTLKASTYQRNKYVCKSLKTILGADTIISNLTSLYIKESFLDTGKNNHSLNELRTRLNALMNWGYQNELIEDISFVTKFKPFPETISQKERLQDKYLEPNELSKLLKQMQDDECYHWYHLTKFFVLSGLRFGELAALTKKDIDLKTKILNVGKTWDHSNRVLTEPKTFASKREVYIQPELEEVIKDILFLGKKQSIEDNKTSFLFFPSRTYNYLDNDVFNSYLKKKALKTTGKNKITAHALRHTHISLLAAEGVDLDTIARRVGHYNSKITREIYLHITEQMKEKDNKKLQQISIFK